MPSLMQPAHLRQLLRCKLPIAKYDEGELVVLDDQPKYHQYRPVLVAFLVMTVQIDRKRDEFQAYPAIYDHARQAPRHKVVGIPGGRVRTDTVRDKDRGNMDGGSRVDHDPTRVAAFTSDIGG